MSLGPLLPRNDGSRDTGSRDTTPRSEEVFSPSSAEFLRPIGSAAYNPLPSADSSLREYMRVLIKRKWMVTSMVVGIFLAVAVASLRQTPIYEAMG